MLENKQKHLFSFILKRVFHFIFLIHQEFLILKYCKFKSSDFNIS